MEDIMRDMNTGEIYCAAADTFSKRLVALAAMGGMTDANMVEALAEASIGAGFGLGVSWGSSFAV